MANVLNKLLTICENLDTNGGSGSGSTGGSGGSVSSGENFIEKSLSSFTPAQLADTNSTNLVIIGRFDEEQEKTKDLTILVRLWDVDNSKNIPLYELHVLQTKYYNGLKVFILNKGSGSNDTMYGSIGIRLNTLTMEGIKFLALKLTNSTIESSKNYKIYFDVIGTDENNTDEYNNYSVYPMSNDEATGFNLQDISKEGKTSYTTTFNCDASVMIG